MVVERVGLALQLPETVADVPETYLAGGPG
jgi:hypothetical protein